MQISTAQMFARGVEQMSEQKSKVTEMQAKLSTGKQILNPSDDAEKAGTIQRIKTAAGRQDSYEKTLNTMNDRLATEDAALRSIDNVMQRVRVLAVQASSDATSAADKKILAVEVESLRGELLALTNIQDSTGNYVFSGSKMRTAPYQADSSGAVTYQGDSNIMEVNVSDQRRMSVNRPGNDVFTPVLRDSVDLEGDAATYLVSPMAARYSFTPPTGATEALTVSDGATTLNIPAPVAGVTGVAAKYTVPVTNSNLGSAAEGDTFTVTVGSATASIPLHPTSADATYAKSTDTAFLAAVNAALDAQSIAYTATATAEGSVILTKDAAGTVSDVPTSKIGATPSAVTVTEATAGVNGVTDVNGGAAYSSAAQMLTEIRQADGYGSLDYTVQLDSTGSKLVFDAKTSGAKTLSNVPTFSQSVSTDSARTEVQEGVTGVVDPESVNRSTGPQRVGFFTVVEDFMEALLANDGDGARRALKEVSQVTDNLSLSMANVGGRMGEIQSQFDVLSDTKIRYAAMLSQEEDLDYAKAVSDLTAEMLSLEAGQATFAKISQMNLFDYIR
jgi:flagellar hook-associated protein 3 FlgL